jgi:hypothetical protein
MCGRYRRTTSEEELARRYHIPIPPERDLPISWNIAPTQDVLAIRLNPETKQRTLDALRWGLIPNWAKDPKIAYKTINARVETVDTAPSCREAFKKRRCLIPADSSGIACHSRCISPVNAERMDPEHSRQSSSLVVPYRRGTNDVYRDSWHRRICRWD